MDKPVDRRHPHVINASEVAPNSVARGGFGFTARRLGPAAGSRALGCTRYELPAGKTAFPFHFHSSVEEAIYILDGSGTARIGDARVDVGAGDFIALPPGPACAHALTAGSDGPLTYLALSGPAAAATVDVCVYPDSKKLAVVAGVEPGQASWRDGAWVHKLIKDEQPKVDYFDDEPLADK